MFSYELRQSKDRKVRVSTLVILFNLLGSSAVSHRLGVKADSALGPGKVMKKREVKHSGCFLQISPITLVPHKYWLSYPLEKTNHFVMNELCSKGRKNNQRRRKWKEFGGRYREIKKHQLERHRASCTNSGTSGVFHSLTCIRAIFNIQLPPEIISLILGKIMIFKCVKSLIFKTKKCIQTLEENTGRSQQAVCRSGYKLKPTKS